jgi:ubiquinone/menaquinone biosynthesis C-methylase UbiE
MTAPDPGKLLASLTLYQLPMALKGALDLELFTHIAAGTNTAAALAPACQASEKGVRILCDYLTIHGFLTKSGDTYALAPDTGIFLDKKSPAYMGTVANFLLHPIMLKNFEDVAAIVRKGGAVYHSTLAPEDEVWVEFARSMAPMMALPAQMMAAQITKPGDAVKVLDIAAGHGIFGISVAKFNPAAKIVAQDWANVLEVAKENAQTMGVADRYTTLPGSAFSVDLGVGNDIVLLPNFLHHFDEATNVGLLKRIHAAMKPGGIVATVEFVPNDDRISPPMSAGFSMMMLGGTDHGDAYTFKELDRMFRTAGFGPSEIRSLAPAPSSLVITQYS